MNNLNRLADDMPFKKNEEKYKMGTVNLNELRRIQNNNDLLIQLIRTISAAYNTSFAKFHSHCEYESMMMMIHNESII